MRFEHTPGDKLFVDYAGKTMAVIDRHTGEVQVAQIFVAALGASHYTYVEAHSHRAWLTGSAATCVPSSTSAAVPAAIVPDNLKSGVQRACRYEPDLNPSYQDFAEHYGVAILPARVRKPRDKAKVEVAVQGIERWILAPLRHQSFFSLADLNQALRANSSSTTSKPLSREAGTRQEPFPAPRSASPAAIAAAPLMSTPLGSEPRCFSTITSSSSGDITPCPTG